MTMRLFLIMLLCNITIGCYESKGDQNGSDWRDEYGISEGTGIVIGKIGIKSINGLKLTTKKRGLIKLLKIEDENMYIYREVFTDSLGFFQIINLEEGIYRPSIKFIEPDSSLTIPSYPNFGTPTELRSRLCNDIKVKNDSISVIRYEIPVFTQRYLDIMEILEWGGVYGHCDYLINYFLCDYLPMTESALTNYNQYCGYNIMNPDFMDIAIPSNTFINILGAKGIRIDSLGILYHNISSLEEIQCTD